MNPDSRILNDEQEHNVFSASLEENYQIRNRTILRRPRSLHSNDHESCPTSQLPNSPRVYERSSQQTSHSLTHHHHTSLMSLQERRSCRESEECKEISHYKWALTGWSSCLPKNMNADSTCGDGVRR